MAKKLYIKGQREIEARPRSKRLRELGLGSAGVSSAAVSGGASPGSSDYATEANHAKYADEADVAKNLTLDSPAWDTIDAKDAATLDAAIADAATKYLSKLSPDTAQALITFLQGIAVGNGTYGIDGSGDAILHAINAQEALFDTLTAANAHFFNLIIDEVKSVGGQLIITPVNCTAVDVQRHLALDDTLYRVYFRASDDDRATVNQWSVGDQAIHYEFDVTAGTTRNYWRLVKAVSSEPVSVELPTGESVMCHWIDLSGTTASRGATCLMWATTSRNWATGTMPPGRTPSSYRLTTSPSSTRPHTWATRWASRPRCSRRTAASIVTT